MDYNYTQPVPGEDQLRSAADIDLVLDYRDADQNILMVTVNPLDRSQVRVFVQDPVVGIPQTANVPAADLRDALLRWYPPARPARRRPLRRTRP